MSVLLPAEKMALTVARAQIERGEEPMPNVAAVCVMALARVDAMAGDIDGMAEAMTGFPMDTAHPEDAEAWRANAREVIDYLRGEEASDAP